LPEIRISVQKHLFGFWGKC